MTIYKDDQHARLKYENLLDETKKAGSHFHSGISRNTPVKCKQMLSYSFHGELYSKLVTVRQTQCGYACNNDPT